MVGLGTGCTILCMNASNNTISMTLFQWELSSRALTYTHTMYVYVMYYKVYILPLSPLRFRYPLPNPSISSSNSALAWEKAFQDVIDHREREWRMGYIIICRSWFMSVEWIHSIFIYT